MATHETASPSSTDKIEAPRYCEAHGVIVYAGQCPDCVEEGVAVMQPAPKRTPMQRVIARAVLLDRYRTIIRRRRAR